MKDGRTLTCMKRLSNRMEGKEHFIFHDGPPYANGNMHVGHMLNKVGQRCYLSL